MLKQTFSLNTSIFRFGWLVDWSCFTYQCCMDHWEKRTCLLTLSYTGGGGGGRHVVALIPIVENFGEIQAIVMKLGDFSWNLLQIIYLAEKLIKACSVSMVTDLLKVLFGSFFFIHIFCCIFNSFCFICAYYQSGRYILIISHWNN